MWGEASRTLKNAEVVVYDFKCPSAAAASSARLHAAVRLHAAASTQEGGELVFMDAAVG